MNNNFRIRYHLGIKNKSWNGSIFECEFVDSTVLYI